MKGWNVMKDVNEKSRRKLWIADLTNNTWKNNVWLYTCRPVYLCYFNWNFAIYLW